MQDIIGSYVERFLKNHQKQKKFISIFVVLSVLVAFGVIWQMKLTGISMNADVTCGKEEHKHSDACYENVLVCGKEETEKITEPSAPVHTHTDACYEQKQKLVCGQTEHQHGDGCYDEEGNLICEIVEHQHSEECKATEKVLVCGLKETKQTEVTKSEPHVHTAACYEKRLVCGKEEHTHTIMCMCDKNADIESIADWEATLPKELKNNWAEDLLSVANSQLGYKESERNFVLDEDGKRTRGYTRYGQWYGNAYGDWCAMFVSWCLNYAEIPKEAVPYASGCYAWTVELDKLGLYQTSDKYTPEAGDIIFFDHNGKIGHVGIVESIDTETSKVHTIEGNSSDKVCKKEYSLADKDIVGYGSLKAAEARYAVKYLGESPEQTLVAEIYTDGTFKNKLKNSEAITVEGAIPKGAIIKAYPVNVEIEGQQVLAAYDITIFLKDGTIYEPEESLKVSFTIPELEEGTDERRLSVSYIPEGEKAQRIASNVEESKVVFEAEHFSVYALALAEAGIPVSSQAELMGMVKNGGTYSLEADITLTSTFDTINLGTGWIGTLDLNGHTITCAANKSLFYVNAGADLTIIDSQQGEKRRIEENPIDGTPKEGECGNLATVTETAGENGQSIKTLTYYVTESALKSGTKVGETVETLVKYQVATVGAIKGTNAPIVNVDNGNFTLASGMFYGSKSRAIMVAGANGRLNLTGGYICDNTVVNNGDGNFYGNGGAVHGNSDAIIELTGTVLAGNKSGGKGGAIALLGGATLNVSKDAVISGNQIAKETGTYGDPRGGGGILCENSTVNISGGYVTNNRVEVLNEQNDRWWNGGAAVFLWDGGTLNLTGGYLTGNYAPAGGAVHTKPNSGAYMSMTGGYVAGNYVFKSEGGGIFIARGGSAEILSGYISHNVTDTHDDWGGGVFCGEGATIKMQNVLITDNDAGGFGGGVAGCSTGEIFIRVTDGAAIYDNSALGEHMSGNGSTKDDDHRYGKDNPFFMSHGYQDYFCALLSSVQGGILGSDEPAGWEGSRDNIEVKDVGANETLDANYVMGLTSNPSQTAIDGAKNVATLFINGNSSYTHGGGILANGTLLIGKPGNVEIGDALGLSGEKYFFDTASNKLEMQAGQFHFVVKDESGKEVMRGTNDEKGNIIFTERIRFDEDSPEGGYVFYLQEETSSDTTIIHSKTVYKITVHVKSKTEEFLDDSTLTSHYISSVTIEKGEIGSDEWTAANAITFDNNHRPEDVNSFSFVNIKADKTNILVEKVWSGDNGVHPESVQVQLYRVYKNEEGNEVREAVGTPITLNANNHWKDDTTWKELPVMIEVNGKTYPCTYVIEEVSNPAGYEVSYSYKNMTGAGGLGYSYLQSNQTVKENTIYYLAETGPGQVLCPGDGNREDIWWSDPNATVDTSKAEKDFIAETASEDGQFYLKYAHENYYLWAKDGNPLGSSTSSKSAFQIDKEGYLQIEDKTGKWQYIYFSHPSANEGAVRPILTTDSSKKDRWLRLYTLSMGEISSDNSTTVTITNTKKQQLYKLDITKVDASNADKKLAGAKFQLFKQDDLENPLTFTMQESGKYVFDSNGTTTDLITVSGGKLYVSGLPEGTYILREKEAPEGYELTSDKEITLGNDSGTTVTVTVEDKLKEYNLPESGGIGTFWYYIGGLLFILIPFLYSINAVARKRKR